MINIKEYINLPNIYKAQKGIKTPEAVRESTKIIESPDFVSKDLQKHIQKLHDYKNLSAKDFRDKYPEDTKGTFRTKIDPSYKEELVKQLPKNNIIPSKQGEINYPITDLRRGDITPFNALWMYPHLSGRQQASLTRQANEDIAAELIGLGVEKGLGKLFKGADLFDLASQPDNPIGERILKGEKVSLIDKIKAGRDKVIAKDPKKAYRAIDDLEAIKEAYNTKIAKAKLPKNAKIGKELGEENYGLDWFLGAYSPKYGKYVIETPAKTKSFTFNPGKQALFSKEIHLKSDPLGIKLGKGTKFYEHTDKGLIELNPKLLKNSSESLFKKWGWK